MEGSSEMDVRARMFDILLVVRSRCARGEIGSPYSANRSRGKDSPGASRFLEKNINVHTGDIDGIGQSENRSLSLGFHTGITLGSGRAFGGGGYFTLSWSGC
jgi:hypothetical protein